jgi:hypothetical protein
VISRRKNTFAFGGAGGAATASDIAWKVTGTARIANVNPRRAGEFCAAAHFYGAVTGGSPTAPTSFLTASRYRARRGRHQFGGTRQCDGVFIAPRRDGGTADERRGLGKEIKPVDRGIEDKKKLSKWRRTISRVRSGNNL